MGGGGGGNNVVSSIPAGSRKIVQSLKEIVNCPEQEIYAALRDCNMDPNEAVNRLLSQDPFHEVKSKREKKKENKDTTDAKPRNSASSRGGRTTTDRYAGRGRANASSSNEHSPLHGKAPYKKENGSHAYTMSSSFASVALGNSGNQRYLPVSDSLTTVKGPSLGESYPSGSLQQTSEFQSAWSGIPGHVSMADIVKMGRPHSKGSGPSNQQNSGCQNTANPSLPSLSDFHSLPGHSKVSISQSVSVNDDWPLDESLDTPNDEWPSFGRSNAALEPPVEANLYGELSNMSFDRSAHRSASQMDRQLPDDRPLENTNYLSTTSISSRNVQEEGQDDPLFDSDVYKNGATLLSDPQAYEHNEDEDSVGAVAGNLQKLTLDKEDKDTTAEEDGPAVVIPDHLQVHTLDCQFLSFGSFAGVSATFSGSASLRSMKNNIGEASLGSDAASAAQADIRNLEHYEDVHLRPTSDADDVHGTVPSITNYNSTSVSQSEVLHTDTSEPATVNQYSFDSASGYSYDNSQSLNAPFTQTQASSQLQNLSPFSGVQSVAQTGRESDLSYLPFPMTHSLPPKYSNVASSVGSSVISTPEGFRGSSTSSEQQQTAQSLPSASPAIDAALQQHLAMQHPYSQPTLPLAPFTNMVYPFLPQNYSYMPSAFQQAFATAAAGNNTFPQSLAAVLPQYKNNLSGSNLPQQSGIAASGYGGFGSSDSSTTGGRSFPLNQPAVPVGSAIGYDDLNHLMSHQQQHQNDNSTAWMHGHGQGSRGVPANSYYNYQSQSQTLRQAPTASHQQHYGSLGYPNYYQSAGISMEQLQLQQQLQQQMARDGSQMGPQGQQTKQQQQLWQNTY